LGDDTATWYRRFVSVGLVGTSVQFVLIKTEFRCKTKLVEGMVQEIMASPLEDVMLNNGAGVDCEV